MKVYAGGFPKMALRVIGASHLLGGLMQMVLSFVQLGITGRDEDELWTPDTANSQPERWQLYLYYPAIAVLFSSFMMITAGLLGIAAPMSYNPHRQASMVSGFKLMTITIAIIFGPLVFGIGLTYAHLLDVDDDVGAMGLVICIFGALTTFMAMCGSCMTCCYSPYTDDPRDFRGDYGGQGDFSIYRGGLGGGMGALGGGPGYAGRYDGPPSIDYRGRSAWSRRF